MKVWLSCQVLPEDDFISSKKQAADVQIKNLRICGLELLILNS